MTIEIVPTAQAGGNMIVKIAIVAVKRQQMAMAKNIANLKTKAAQKRQAHVLCTSLIESIKAGM